VGGGGLVGWGISIPATGIVVYITLCKTHGLSQGSAHAAGRNNQDFKMFQLIVLARYLLNVPSPAGHAHGQSHRSDQVRGHESLSIAWPCFLAKHLARRLCCADHFRNMSHKP